MATIAGGLTDYTFSQTLDTSGNATDALEVRAFRTHALTFTIARPVTNMVVRAEGSTDASTFFGLDPSGNQCGDTSGNLTFTTHGTHTIVLRDTPVNYIRLRLVSYAGTGALSATSIKYRGIR